MAKAKIKKPTQLEPGMRFQTNAAFDNLWPKLSRVVQWRGVLVRRHDSVEGAWHVKVIEPEGLPVQVLNEKFMEAER